MTKMLASTEDRGQTDHVTSKTLSLTLTFDPDFQSRRAKFAEYQGQGVLVQTIEWKQAGRRTRPIAVLLLLAQLVISAVCMTAVVM